MNWKNFLSPRRPPPLTPAPFAPSDLPAASASEASASPAPPPPLSPLAAAVEPFLTTVVPASSAERIVVLHTETAGRELLCEVWKHAGASVRPCADFSALTEALESFYPTRVVLDLVGPDFSGWELLRALKARREMAALPVSFVSVDPIARRVLALGPLDILLKPITRGDFTACLERTLDCRELRYRQVLLVDDFIEFHEIMRLWIGPEINTIRTAENGRDALDRLADFAPDIIFIDLMMPVMGGFEFLQQLRKRNRGAQTPVVLMSGKSPRPSDLESIRESTSEAF